VNCREIGVPGMAARSRTPTRASEVSGSMFTNSKPMPGIRKQFANSVLANKARLPWDVEHFLAGNTQSDGEHHQDNEEVEQQQRPKQHTILREPQVAEPARIWQESATVKTCRCQLAFGEGPGHCMTFL